MQSNGVIALKFNYLDFISKLIVNWPKIIALLEDLGILPKDKAEELRAARFGDGKFLDLIAMLVEYVPQIIDVLVKLGILKPKEGATIREFGDGELMKKLIQLFLKILPLILLFLGEEATDISDKP